MCEERSERSRAQAVGQPSQPSVLDTVVQMLDHYDDLFVSEIKRLETLANHLVGQVAECEGEAKGDSEFADIGGAGREVLHRVQTLGARIRWLKQVVDRFGPYFPG